MIDPIFLLEAAINDYLTMVSVQFLEETDMSQEDILERYPPEISYGMQKRSASRSVTKPCAGAWSLSSSHIMERSRRPRSTATWRGEAWTPP